MSVLDNEGHHGLGANGYSWYYPCKLSLPGETSVYGTNLVLLGRLCRPGMKCVDHKDSNGTDTVTHVPFIAPRSSSSSESRRSKGRT